MIQIMPFASAKPKIRALRNGLVLCSVLVSACATTKLERADLRKLEDAAGKGDLTAVQVELKKRFDANQLNPKDSDHEFVDFAPLHVAAFNGHNEIVRALIDRGVNVNLNIHPARSPEPQDKQYIAYVYQTPLISAIMGDRVETAKLLIERGADVNRSFQYDAANRPIHAPLTIASGRGNLELVKLLIQSGAKVDPPGLLIYGEQDRPLATAIQYGKEEIAKFLLQNDAQVTFLDVDRAKERGLTEVAHLIQKKYEETDALEQYKRFQQRLKH